MRTSGKSPVSKTLNDVGLVYQAQPVLVTLSAARRGASARDRAFKAKHGQDDLYPRRAHDRLHIADVHRLIDMLMLLVESGNTVVVIEHNLEVIKTADHIIDLGPEGGDRGGYVVCTGTPEEIAANPDSYTGQFLKKVL